ncbi:MAG: acetyl-CoA carboxylase biotin carboxyl carrier protein [bacterium]|nr:acetyl-CoA carboxylase biotin carboxyl carrier protein [bacterium]
MKFGDINIKELLMLMKEHDVDELSLKDGKTSIDLKRNQKTAIVNPGTAVNGINHSFANAAGAAVPETANTAAVEEPKIAEAPPPPETAGNGYHTVEAPLVGTFYRATSPEADPFVEIGDTIKTGDVLCIVEAMKSMNEIQADVSGVIKDICVDNAELVEFEQALFKVEAAG